MFFSLLINNTLKKKNCEFLFFLKFLYKNNNLSDEKLEPKYYFSLF